MKLPSLNYRGFRLSGLTKPGRFTEYTYLLGCPSYRALKVIKQFSIFLNFFLIFPDLFGFFLIFFEKKEEKTLLLLVLRPFDHFCQMWLFFENYITMRNIILGHFQSKLVIQIASKVQKPHFKWFYVSFSTFNPFYPILGIFGQYEIFSKNYITIRNIILGHFQSKLVTQIASKVKKTHFWAIGHIGHMGYSPFLA